MAERRIVRAVIIGASGRMGRAIADVVARDGEIRIVGAIVSPGSANVGREFVAGIKLGADLDAALRAADVALDFSRPEAAESHLEACRKARKPLLLGTTGLPASLDRTLEAAARDIALLVAPNTSVGIAVLVDLVQRAARALPRDFDVEISEAHHREKRDAPSGTALSLGETIAGARGETLAARRAPPRDGVRVRQPGEIGFAVVRAGDIVGEHEVRFAGDGEHLILGHRATDRGVFARGAIKAATWLVAQPPGRYVMRDVLALKSTA